MKIPNELRTSIEDGSAQLWTEFGRVDCTIIISGDCIELDVDIDAEAVTIGWGHEPSELVELEHVEQRRWRVSSQPGITDEPPEWEPATAEVQRMKKHVPNGVTRWAVSRSKAGWFYTVRFLRRGRRIEYRGTQRIDIPVSSAQMSARCYWCGRPSTSKEHVPAKVFYADTSGTSGITVPSCALHNQNFSEIDTAFFVTIALMASADHLPQCELSQRAASRATTEVKRSSTIRKMVFKEALRYGFFEGVVAPMAKIERMTVDLGIEKIVRGLYRHHYGRPWDTDEVWSNTPQLVDEGHPFADSRMLAVFERDNPPWHHPASPEVFEYQGLRAREVVFWRLRFFNSVDFVVTNATKQRMELQKLSQKLQCEGPFGDQWFPIPDAS